VITADGLMGFLGRDELMSLLDRLVAHFPRGELVLNGYTRFTIWVARHAPGTRSVADQVRFPGMDDPREPERWNPRLKLIEDADQPAARDRPVPRVLRTYYRLQSHSTWWSRKGTLILHYRF
jgi:O-methyltransferase involved in polyketide biosynthesis